MSQGESTLKYTLYIIFGVTQKSSKKIQKTFESLKYIIHFQFFNRSSSIQHKLFYNCLKATLCTILTNTPLYHLQKKKMNDMEYPQEVFDSVKAIYFDFFQENYKIWLNCWQWTWVGENVHTKEFCFSRSQYCRSL